LQPSGSDSGEEFLVTGRVCSSWKSVHSYGSQADALTNEVKKGVKLMSDVFLAVVCLIIGFVGGHFFGKTKVAKEFETKAGKIGDVIKLLN
jgi:hypothetical protein